MSEFSVRELLERHAGDELELHARTVNPQFVRMLRAIGFDRRWARAEGAHLYDAEGDRYLDWLGGFGMYNVGRNNPRVRAALQEALELDTPGKLALGVNPLGAILADELLQRAPASLGRVLFSSSGTEAIEAAIKIGRAATGRTRVRLGGARLPRADARRALRVRRSCVLRALPAARARLLARSVRRPRRARGGATHRGRGALRRRAGRRPRRLPACRPGIWRARRSCVVGTGRSSAWTRSRRASGAPAGSSRSSTGGSSRTSSSWRSRSRAATCRWGRRSSGPRCSMPSSTRSSTR